VLLLVGVAAAGWCCCCWLVLLLVGVVAACCSNGTHLLHLKTIVAGSISCGESAENGRNCEETQDSNGNCQAVSGPAEISHTTSSFSIVQI
jgi:hypothetical protein